MRVATFNVHHRRPSADVTRDVLQLTDIADVICLQEMGGHTEHLRDHLPTTWSVYTPPVKRGQPGGEQDTPIAYRHVVRANNRGYRHVSPPTKVEYDGNGGGSDVEEKDIVWVRFHPPSLGPLVVLNLHAVAGIERGGHPDHEHPQRLRVLAKMMTALTKMVVVRRPTPVVVCGDFNVDWRSDNALRDRRFPVHHLAAVGVQASYASLGDQGLHGRLIDWVCASHQLRPTSQHLIQHGYGSDHAPVVVEYR